VKTVQVVLDEQLLRAVDREARRAKLNRSEVFRLAARQYLERRRIEELERRHREGYERFPPVEFDVWDRVAAWPDDRGAARSVTATEAGARRATPR
jgi:hypothetical protein